MEFKKVAKSIIIFLTIFAWVVSDAVVVLKLSFFLETKLLSIPPEIQEA